MDKILPVFYCKSSSGNVWFLSLFFFFPWNNFLALWGDVGGVKLARCLASTSENTLPCSPLPSCGAEKGHGAWKRTPDPVAGAGGTTLIPWSQHRQQADGSSTLFVPMVEDRGIFCWNKGLHREKQLSRFQRKMLLVTEMIGGVHWSNWNCKIIRIRVHRVHTEVIHCILIGQFLRK